MRVYHDDGSYANDILESFTEAIDLWKSISSGVGDDYQFMEKMTRLQQSLRDVRRALLSRQPPSYHLLIHGMEGKRTDHVFRIVEYCGILYIRTIQVIPSNYDRK